MRILEKSPLLGLSMGRGGPAAVTLVVLLDEFTTKGPPHIAGKHVECAFGRTMDGPFVKVALEGSMNPGPMWDITAGFSMPTLLGEVLRSTTGGFLDTLIAAAAHWGLSPEEGEKMVVAIIDAARQVP